MAKTSLDNVMPTDYTLCIPYHNNVSIHTMKHLQLHDMTLDFDDDGFLLKPETWTEAAAQCIAINDGIGKLTDIQLRILRRLREHYFKTHSVAPVRTVCHESNLGSLCFNEYFANHGIEAWRLAGLPYPGEEVRTYL